MKNTEMNVMFFILAACFGILTIFASVGINRGHNITALTEENASLKEKLVESEINREWIEEYIDLINEIWEKELENRVLENEIKWLKVVNNMEQSNIIPNQQVYDDFEVFLGLVVRYYTDEITISIDDYIYQQNPLVYARIQQYEDLWG